VYTFFNDLDCDFRRVDHYNRIHAVDRYTTSLYNGLQQFFVSVGPFKSVWYDFFFPLTLCVENSYYNNTIYIQYCVRSGTSGVCTKERARLPSIIRSSTSTSLHRARLLTSRFRGRSIFGLS